MHRRAGLKRARRWGDDCGILPRVTETPRPQPPSALRIVTPRYGADVVGGAERLVRALAESLVAVGWRVEVFTSCAVDAATWADALPSGVSVEDGVVVRRFAVRAPRRPELFRQVSRGFFRLPSVARPERVWVDLQGPWVPGLLDALRLATPMPALFAPYLYYPTLVGLPAYVGPRVLLPAAHDELPLRLRAVARALRAADGLLFGTVEEREIVVSRHPFVEAMPFAVGNVGVVAPADVDGLRFRASVGLGPDEPYLLYGGRVAEGKGMAELLGGVSQLRAQGRRVRLVLTGEAGVVTPASDAVLPVGRLDEAARWDALAGAAAVVVPSFHESLSLLALEACAVGRPVLGNGASPVLAGQVARSGGGIAYRGAGELASAAARVLGDVGLAAALGESGRAWVASTYRWEGVHERVRGLIARAVVAAEARGWVGADWSGAAGGVPRSGGRGTEVGPDGTPRTLPERPHSKNQPTNPSGAAARGGDVGAARPGASPSAGGGDTSPGAPTSSASREEPKGAAAQTGDGGATSPGASRSGDGGTLGNPAAPPRADGNDA